MNIIFKGNKCYLIKYLENLSINCMKATNKYKNRNKLKTLDQI